MVIISPASSSFRFGCRSILRSTRSKGTKNCLFSSSMVSSGKGVCVLPFKKGCFMIISAVGSATRRAFLNLNGEPE